MAKPSKKSKKNPSKKSSESSASRVTRISASDDKAAKKPASQKDTTVVHKLSAAEKADAVTAKSLHKLSDKPSKAEEAAQKAEKQKPSRVRRNPFRALGAYFKGAWYELRQVRWPDRKNSIQMTIALLIFTAFIGSIILLLDWLFQYLFELMIG